LSSANISATSGSILTINRPDDYFIGVRMGDVFKLGKEFAEMPVDEIERLLESPVHEVRAGAMSIMGQCAKGKKMLARTPGRSVRVVYSPP
jgi:hypothetical protein